MTEKTTVSEKAIDEIWGKHPLAWKTSLAGNPYAAFTISTALFLASKSDAMTSSTSWRSQIPLNPRASMTPTEPKSKFFTREFWPKRPASRKHSLLYKKLRGPADRADLR